MGKPLFPIVMLIALTATAPLAAQAQPSDAGAPELAERVAQMAHITLTGQIIDSTLRQATALLEAATRIHPAEPRFHRLLADAYIELGEVGHAVDVLADYRRLQPDDQVAQVQIINLFVSQMESADERLKYLRDIAGTEALPRVVRAHAAGRAAVILAERSQESDSLAVTRQALELNPVNLDALQLQYERAMNTRDPAQRVRAILTWLRASPAQPDLLAQMADELARAGLPDRATNWYGRSFGVYAGFGRGIPSSLFAHYAAELYLAGQVKLADAAVMQVLEADPSSVDAWFVRLVIARDSEDQQQANQFLEQSRQVLVDRINALHAELEGAAPAKSDQLPDLMADAKRLAEEDRPALRDLYAAAVGDLAWHQIYFARNPAATGPLIEALRVTVPGENVIVPRLEGWAFLVNKRPDEARVKLSAIADRDPLAALGLLQLQTDNDAASRTEQAQRLLNRHPYGLIGALLQQALRPHEAKVVPVENASAILAELEQFNEDWLAVTERPEQFYLLRAQPMKVSHQFGEPVLARITLQNLRDFPITIEERGLLRPDLWFDAQLRGAGQQYLQGVAYDRLGQRTVLGPKESISQVVRVDRGPLAQRLAGNPIQFIPIQLNVVLNPLAGAEAIRPGPGGSRAQFDRIVERAASPLASAQHQQQVMAQISGTDTVAKIRTIDLLAAYVRMIRSAKDAPQEMQQLQPRLIEAIENTTSDPSPSVQTYSRFVLATIYSGEKQQAMIQQLADAEQWPRRLLATALVALLPADQQKATLEKLSTDADQTVSAYARATSQTLAHAADSAGATQPTTLPVPGTAAPAPAPLLAPAPPQQ